MASAYAAASSTAASVSNRTTAPPRSTQPAGTFLPGTKVQVGNQKVTIDRYLSEGGFAHVYVVRIPRDGGKHELAVLKRVAVPDKEHLASMRTEVETMKKLMGHKHVVTYMDSHASQLNGGGYEVFLLMEFCSGGGLIDFMNTRLQHRLTEPEILKIFGDVAEGLACMHYLKPPLLHRDLKVENVLIGKSTSGTALYKLCDFGSTAPPRPAATTAEEGRLIEEDVQKHTTMQYRSPEMIDVWRKQPIDEKADIWALGVFLYKLCYYTTPFEDVGQMAILNASYKFPAYPSFSDRLKRLISIMLKEDPKLRPNIYQVIKETCNMRGVEVPVKDIYASRTQSEARRNESLPAPEASRAAATVGLQKVAPQVRAQALPDITPGRRGRPTAPSQQASAAKPNPPPVQGDPFAALDSKNYEVKVGAVDELSKRFPSLDEFSIAHEKSGTFPFQTSVKSPPADVPKPDLSERVTAALADEVFGQVKSKPEASKPSQVPQQKPPVIKSATIPVVRELSKESPLVHQPTPIKTGNVRYVSTGVGSSPPPVKPKIPEINARPIWRIPDQDRSSSQPRASAFAQAEAATLQPSLPPIQRPALHEIHRSKSQTATNLLPPNATHSSRPSLEGHRSSSLDVNDTEIHRARSMQNWSRPTSMHVGSNIDFLRDQETSRKRPSTEIRRPSRRSMDGKESAAADPNIDSDMEFLRTSEDADLARRKSNRKSGGQGYHKQRSSLGSLSGAKQMIADRFEDACKRFESHPKDEKQASEVTLIIPEPQDNDNERRMLSPIEGSVHGSEIAASRHSDLDSPFDETEDLPPDVKREMERRRLSQEEKRVSEAAAEYRARVAVHGTGGAPPNRALNIQKRVQSLLEEGRQSPTKRTAEGYGRYTEQPPSQSHIQSEPLPAPQPPRPSAPPALAQKPSFPLSSNNPYPNTRQQQSSQPVPLEPTPMPSVQSLSRNISGRPGPSVPPKSNVLRTGTGTGGGGKWPPPTTYTPSRPPQASSPKEKALPPHPGGGLAALLAKDLEGVPDYPPSAGEGNAPARTVTSAFDAPPSTTTDDLEANFSKRFPSLAGIEMVETEITGRGDGDGGGGRTVRMREV